MSNDNVIKLNPDKDFENEYEITVGYVNDEQITVEDEFTITGTNMDIHQALDKAQKQVDEMEQDYIIVGVDQIA